MNEYDFMIDLKQCLIDAILSTLGDRRYLFTKLVGCLDELIVDIGEV